LLAGVAGGLLLTWLQVPAGTLLGSVLGASLATGGVTPGQKRLNASVRVVGLVLLGCVSAARLDPDSFDTLVRLFLPVVAGVAALLALNVLLARWLVRRHGVDPTTAVLACAPGGFSELSVMAVREGADVATVAVVHMVRVLVVVLVVVPTLVAVLSGMT
jgi:membrane AbrB-like protein